MIVVGVPRDIAGGDSHADLNGERGSFGLTMHRLLEGHAGGHAGRGTVEDGHEAVTHDLHDRAAVVLDRGAQNPFVLVPEHIGRVVPERCPECGRAHHVGEEHRASAVSGGHPSSIGAGREPGAGTSGGTAPVATGSAAVGTSGLRSRPLDPELE